MVFDFALVTSNPDTTSAHTVYQDPNCIWFNRKIVGLLTSGAFVLDFSEQDLTDGDGHGKLVATDSIFCYFDTSGITTTAFTVVWKIWYRFVAVGLVDYLGIVQSQQRTS